MLNLHIWHVFAGGQQIVEKGSVFELAKIVINHFFHQCFADTLGDTSLDLTVDDGWID